MSCDRFQARLDDEEAVSAQRAGRHAPEDLRAHMLCCRRCAALWRETASELARLGADLAEPLPPRLEAAAAAALRAAYPAEPLIDWRPAAVWAVCGAGLAGCALLLTGAPLPGSWQIAVLLAATAAGLTAQITRQALDAA